MIDIRKGVIVSRTNLIDSKKEASIPWKGIILVFIITVSIWVAAFMYNRSINQKIILVQTSLNSLKQNRNYENVAIVSDNESRLNSIEKLLEKRLNWTKLFQKLEENTIPDVTFSGLVAQEPDDKPANSIVYSPGAPVASGGYEIELKGSTIGLSNLAKQILVFEAKPNEKSEPFASDVKVTKIEMKKTNTGELIDQAGAIDFAIRIVVNQKIFENEFITSNQ